MVELVGSTVVLREFRMSDVDATMAIVGDERVTTTLSFDSLTREQQSERIAATIQRAGETPRTEYYLAATLKSDGRLIGFGRLGLTGVRAAKLGGALAADHWGAGYALDGARTLLDFAFGDLDLHRVTAAIGPDNHASIAAVTRLGFVYEGTLRDHVYTNQAWRDSRLYSMLAQDWTPDAH
ncbi:GNAT family N-acetyltransferase [Actinokineospora enzanensis]|uniref:GNAT family N-acetyltransferase n=1 Tax=Actinokineospora enzanensis TaxID=155975 RepID=UPI0003774BB6|nr:GNAT family protein [Actinokineospora enzanensis]